MEITIQISGQAMSVEISIGVYAYLDQADHKAYFSLDCEDGIENDAIGWEQPSPEELFIQAEEHAYAELFLRRLEQALRCLTPPQAYVFMLTFFLANAMQKLLVMRVFPPVVWQGQSVERLSD